MATLREYAKARRQKMEEKAKIDELERSRLNIWCSKVCPVIRELIKRCEASVEPLTTSTSGAFSAPGYNQLALQVNLGNGDYTSSKCIIAGWGYDPRESTVSFLFYSSVWSAPHPPDGDRLDLHIDWETFDLEKFKIVLEKAWNWVSEHADHKERFTFWRGFSVTERDIHRC